MKKNIVFNKYYKNLRENVFSKLEIEEFMNIYLKFKRLNIQHKILKIANFLEKLTIPTIDIPIIRFHYKISKFLTLENIRLSNVAY